MNYIKITSSDIANGTGIRVTLWTAGCKHNCLGCHNPETHSFSAGKVFDQKAEEALFKELDKPYVAGLTLSGGDPTEHLTELLPLLQKFRDKYGKTKNIWMYTGYSIDEIIQLYPNIEQYIDTIVDGKYIAKLRNISLAFRGSDNQKIWKYDGDSWICSD